MTRAFWKLVGGTLIEEFQAVKKGEGSGQRLLDGVILPYSEARRQNGGTADLDGQNIIVVQTKAKRLGMYLLGQAVFSPYLIRQSHDPASILSVALCTKHDEVLEACLSEFPNLRVVTAEEVDRWLGGEPPPGWLRKYVAKRKK